MKWLWISGLISMLGIGTPLAWRLQQQEGKSPSESGSSVAGASSLSPAEGAANDPFFGTTAPAQQPSSGIDTTASSPNSRPALSRTVRAASDLRAAGSPSSGQNSIAAFPAAPGTTVVRDRYFDDNDPSLHREYRSASDQASFMAALASDPASAEEMRLKTETARLLALLRGADESTRPQLIEQLTAVTTEYFALLQQRRMAELTDLETRLSEVRQRIEAREAARDEIVARRVRELTGDVSLDWDESREVAGAAIMVPRRVRTVDAVTGATTDRIIYQQGRASIESDWLPAAPPAPSAAPSLPYVDSLAPATTGQSLAPVAPLPSFPSAPLPPPSPPSGLALPPTTAEPPSFPILPSASEASPESNSLPRVWSGPGQIDDAVERMLMADFDQPQHWAAAQLTHARLVRLRAEWPEHAAHLDRTVEIIHGVLQTRLTMLQSEHETLMGQIMDGEKNLERLKTMFDNGQIPEPAIRQAEAEYRQMMSLRGSRQLLQQIAEDTVALYAKPRDEATSTDDASDLAPSATPSDDPNEIVD